MHALDMGERNPLAGDAKHIHAHEEEGIGLQGNKQAAQ